MASGIGGSLDIAFRRATNLAQWLEQEHKLSRSEVAIVMGLVRSMMSVKSLTANFTLSRVLRNVSRVVCRGRTREVRQLVVLRC